MVHEGVSIAEQDVRDALLLGDLPHSLLVVQIRRVLGKPENLDVLTDLRMSQESPGLFRRMDRSVVQSQDDSLPSPSSANDQPTDKEDELCAVLSTLGHSRNQGAVFSGSVVDRPEGCNLAVLSRRGDLKLLSSAHPGSRQVRVKMEVGFVLEPELESSSTAKSPFFRA